MSNREPKQIKPLLGQRWSEAMWVLGIFLVSLGVALSSKADLGVSMIAAPAFIVQEALVAKLPWLTVGVTEYIWQGVVLLVMCVIVRKFDWRYLLAFLVAVIYGYVLDMWLMALGQTAEEVYLKWILMVAGALTTAVGVACFFRTYLPLEVYELVVAEVAKRYSFRVEKTKLVYDLVQLLITAVLAFSLFDPTAFDWSEIYKKAYHSLGAGTVFMTLVNAPVITVIGKGLDRLFGYEPLLPALKRVLTYRGKIKEKEEKEENAS